MAEEAENKTFWEHLDDLRAVILRIVGVVCVATVGCFCFKEAIFELVFAPSEGDFILYRILGRVAGVGAESIAPPDVRIINTELAGQLIMHLKVALGVGIVVTVPYVVWAVANYLAPALYAGERRAMRTVFCWGTALFYVGMLVSYVLVFPLAYRFLVAYQVGEMVENMISLESYVDNLLLLCLLMGVLFELPIVAVALSRVGIIDARIMRTYRRHAVLVILTVAAIVTPTTDIFTLLLVALPVYFLYEVSIVVVGKSKRQERGR